jgi:hypothetical protein
MQGPINIKLQRILGLNLVSASTACHNILTDAHCLYKVSYGSHNDAVYERLQLSVAV